MIFFILIFPIKETKFAVTVLLAKMFEKRKNSLVSGVTDKFGDFKVKFPGEYESKMP
jgi:hypothetical protein